MKTKDGLWKLSPSGLYGFEECKSCFWLDHHHGKAPSLPWLLNSAMDGVLKSRYDLYREKGELPPEIASLGKEGVKLFPMVEMLNKWRGSTAELKVVDEKVGYELGGKLDDVLLEEGGLFIPTDFKSSGFAPKEEKKKYYILQLTAYGFMFTKHGIKTSDRAILLHYFVKDTKNPSLDVHFDCYVDPFPIDLAAFPKKLEEIVALLNGAYPGDDLDCKDCVYHAGRMAARA